MQPVDTPAARPSAPPSDPRRCMKCSLLRKFGTSEAHITADHAHGHPTDRAPAPRSGDGDPTPPDALGELSEWLSEDGNHRLGSGVVPATAPSREERQRWLAALASPRAARARAEEPDVEAVSACVHDAWMATKRAAGVTSRRSESGEELMVPYDQLSETAKELDRATVRAVLAAIAAARASGQPEAVSRDA